MRSIKFRQANFTKGKFSGWHYWGFLGDGRFDGIQTGTMSIKEAHEKSQQFTGRKDKNGVEIYEGDRMRDCNGLDVTWVIEWCEEEACFLGLDWCGNPNEVIGNIYEEESNGNASSG